MTTRLFIDTTTGTYGEAAQLRIVDVTPQVLEDINDERVDVAHFGQTYGQKVIAVGDIQGPARMYVKCAHCHLFVEANPAHDHDPTLAEYVHLHRGDEADERLDASHEPELSCFEANLATWRVFGPSAMRERFVDLETGEPYSS